jgi:hypothetical protein
MSFAPTGALSRVSIVMGRHVYRRTRAGSQVKAVRAVERRGLTDGSADCLSFLAPRQPLLTTPQQVLERGSSYTDPKAARPLSR